MSLPRRRGYDRGAAPGKQSHRLGLYRAPKYVWFAHGYAR